MGNPTDLSTLAASLSEAQRRAVLAMPKPREFETVQQGKFLSRSWAFAKDIGVHGATLASLNPFGGVDPKTLLCGPFIVSQDWCEGRRHWSLTELGGALRDHLERNG